MIGEIYYIPKHDILVILYGFRQGDTDILVTFACANNKETALAQGTTLDEMEYVGDL